MSALGNPRHEMIAQGVARGKTLRASALKAGYGNAGGFISKMAVRDDFKARVAEINEFLDWGATGDLAPVINELARGAKTAMRLGSAAGVKAAGELLRLVAELKQRLPPPAPAWKPPPPPPMTAEAWSRKYKAIAATAEGEAGAGGRPLASPLAVAAVFSV